MKIYEVKSVTDELYNAFIKLIPQLSPEAKIPEKDDLKEIVNAEHTKLFIAEDEQILGTLTLVLNKIPTGNKAWIEDVVLDEKARGRGVGKALTQFAIDYACQKGYKKIDLTSTPERVVANKLYQKLGFNKRETNVYRLRL